MTSLGSFLWIAAIGALFYYMMSKGGGCCGGGGHDHGDHNQDEHKEHNNSKHAAHHEQIEDKQSPEFVDLRDPVCGMEVNKNSNSLVSDHFGHTFHFCSEQCRKLFDINPNKYAGSL